ncbi:MAG: lycopene cyclase domain-containing protein [Bacteroidetes bacterium]|nr:lycopene cyclase domain-containing protein [Bacteroidota bacterium]
MNAFYLLLDLAVIAFPLALSFDRKVAFYRQWRFVWPAIVVNAVLFLAQDALFNAHGVWGFNDRYLLGPRLLGLPIEEILFFVAIPYACLFLYETLKVYAPKIPTGEWLWWLLAVLMVVFSTVAARHMDRWYTFSAFGFAAVLLAVVRAMRVSWMGYFGLFFLVQLIPFFLVNSALTGSFTPEPVVWYSDAHNLGIRMGTIPFEDAFYSLTMLLLPVTLFEWMRARAAKPVLAP